jgi:hypothetical protein
MASKSSIEHGTAQVRDRITAILFRLDMVASGTPASDDAVELLRDLNTALDSFDLRSVDIRNAAAGYRG